MNMDKIEKIRAEIGRLKEPHERNLNKPMERGRIGYAHGCIDCCDKILDFLDTLSEEPDKSLEEAARLYAIPHYMKDIDVHHIEEYPYDTGLEAAFKAGAEWMANQGISFEDKVYPTTDWKGDIDGYCIDGTQEIDLMCEAVPKGLFQVGDKVIVQIRKKED